VCSSDLVAPGRAGAGEVEGAQSPGTDRVADELDHVGIVGLVRVIKEHYPDETDTTGRFGIVDVVAVQDMPNPMTLGDIKANPDLENMVLVNNSRLSIQPVTEQEWQIICRMGGLDAPPVSKAA